MQRRTEIGPRRPGDAESPAVRGRQALSAQDDARLRPLIQRIATGPKLSKDLSREEARDGLAAVLDGGAHPVQAAIFLIALRMKRESDDENLGLLDALLGAAVRVHADVPLLVDVSEPYDGFTKTLPVSPFLPPLLAACGVPAVSHGTPRMGPKFGITHAGVLRAAGVPADLAPADGAQHLARPDLGWCYLDQSRTCPALFALEPLRSLMVKRTALSTLERVMAPVRAAGRTHLLAGYVHVAYPRVYGMLARCAGIDTVTLVRGVEGGVLPSLRQQGQAWTGVAGEELESVATEPLQAGIERDLRGIALPEPAVDLEAAAAREGQAALAGAAGPARDALIYAAALTLWQLGLERDLAAAAARVRGVLDSGVALAHLEAARQV
jgi:anthranilate phosphoribosyltransferase